MKNYLFLVFFLLLWMLSLPAQGVIRYVKPSTALPTVWEDQAEVYNTIAEAISAAMTDDEIWIAGGEYEIGEGGISYNVAKNLKFYGSFAGIETSVSERAKVINGEEWEFQNPTILKMTAGSTSIWINNTSITATFDGLTFDGDNISGTRGIGGGGWSNLTVTRCIIKNNNISGGYGAGILGKNKIAIEYCLVENNKATKPASGSKWGGAVCVLAANSSVKYSTIKNNTYDDSGAGIGIDNVTGVTISYCHLTGNSTTTNGGGLVGYQLADIHNCWIENNSARSGGGIYFRCYAGSGVAYNNIIVNNTSTMDGSGIYVDSRNNASNIRINNSIIARNTGASGVYLKNSTTTPAKLINCILYGNMTSDNLLNNVMSEGANIIFKNNIIDTNVITNITQTACIVETNASKLFADISSGDFTPPTQNFAGEDKGDATDLEFEGNMDYAGVSRVQGDNIEIGPYEITPSSLVTLKYLNIDGALIEGFLEGTTTYDIALQSPVTSYPTITVEPTVSSAVVSEFTYNPSIFDSDIINVVTFSVTNGDNMTSYTLNFKVDKMPEISHLILMRIRADKMTRNKVDLEADVDEFLSKMEANGSFTDCHYVSEERGDVAVLDHVNRLREMGLAYTQPGNKYYEDETLYAKIVKGFEFWYSKHWKDNNWYHNRIGHPQRLGEAFIAMYGGKKDIRNEPIFDSLVARWRSEMGDPDSPNDATTAGANKCDIAMHWIYRSCLTNNEADLAKAADRSFLIIENTTGEGLQHDWSYRQHGAQLYIGGYGTDFINLVVKQASYLAGTQYALSGEKLDILSNFIFKTYLPVIRGSRMNFSVLGRSVTRSNRTNESGFAATLNKLKEVDAANAAEYDKAIKRLKGEEAADFQLPSFQTHYYRSEYTLHQRPEYTFDVRMASSRMVRSEYDIRENRQGFFLSDGATGIFVDGEEYGTILPFWNWKKIPGATIPDLEMMRRADSYIYSGRSSYAGGVTDGKYGVTAFDMINNQALFAWNDDDGYSGTPNNSGTRLPALDFGAKKSWFIFDKEIVCLGAGIYSGHDEPIFTTVNQCKQVGDVVITSEETQQTVSKGVHSYNTVDWVFNDKVAYFFPNKPNLYVANETKTGAWSDINTNYSTDQITGELFTLWFDHGVRPTDARYAYIIVPNVRSVDEVKSYKHSNIEILANTDSVQVVYHKELNVYGLAFFKAASFKNSKFLVEASAGCVMLVKDADKEEIVVFVSDPQKQGSPIKLGIKTPHLKEEKGIVYENPASPHQGKSLEFIVNNETAKYEGKDVLLDRSDWTIIASSEGPVDATVAVDGDIPGYMIDGDNKSAFLFVKPNKSLGGVSVPAGAEVSFTIDLKQSIEMTYLLYRHRDYSNTNSMLRASKGSFYGKNTEEEEFQLIIQNFSIATNVTEVRIDFPAKVSYRYVKFVMEEWDTASGSTIQVSEFNLGNTVFSDLETGLSDSGFETDAQQISIYPNPVKAGEPFNIQLNENFTDAQLTIYNLSGIKVLESQTVGNFIKWTIREKGAYIIKVQKNDAVSSHKVLVR